MRFHVLGFAKPALDASGGDVQLVAVPEQAFSQDAANNFLVPTPLQCFASYVGGVGLTRARFNTGSTRARGFPQIYPLNLTVLPPTPVALQKSVEYPIPLARDESLRIDVTNAAAANTVALAWVTPEPINTNINTPQLRWIRATLVQVTFTLGWSTPGTIVLQDVIEGGYYDIYGLAVQSATCIAARLILQGEFYRPGCLGQALNTAVPDQLFNGKLGKWGTFNTYSPPQLETLDSAAGTPTANIWLLCGKAMAG